MIDRIKQIMEMENLTPSQFADEIDIQRSSLSHVLSGRNKPSLDFVMKVKLCFTDINLEWLIFGNGRMLESPTEVISETNQSENTLFDSEPGSQKSPDSTVEVPVTKEKFTDVDQRNEENNVIHDQKPMSDGENNTVEKVLLLLQDGTFREYTK